MTLSNTGIGGALLAMLRDIFLQAARAIGGDTAQALTPTNVESIFNATGSMLVRPPMYAAQLSVPGRLPFAAATVLGWRMTQWPRWCWGVTENGYNYHNRNADPMI